MRRFAFFLVLMLSSACRKPVEVRLEAGDAAAALGDWKEARAQWQQAADADATSVQARTRLGYAAWALGDLAAAQRAWSEAAKLDPSNAEAADGLARVALENHDAGAALAQVNASPQVRVRALLLRGDHVEALKLARTLGAGDEARYLLGAALLTNAQYDEATKVFSALPPALGEPGLAHVAAARALPEETLTHLAKAKVAQGARWDARLIAQDAAFEFISDSPGFKALTAP